ncbi:MAG: phage terminase large subunit [Desulfovibrio sp.]|nr:phage terminase large subunit [Desulfovibrio sp.]
MDKALRERELRLLRAEKARRSFASFVTYTWPHYLMGGVHELICRELDAVLEAVAASASPRLMITMPPRHGKSELTSRRFPAYAFGRHPDSSIISTSYSADLSSRMNRDVQRIMDDYLYQEIFPAVTLSGRNIRTVASGNYLRNSDIFEIVGHGGSYRSSGVGGGITGMGGDIIIIDDPTKDRAEADSPTIRAKVWDWYTSTLYTRLAPGGGILLIQTRWHMDDLAGRLLEAERAGEGDIWRCVNFPAVADRDEQYRAAGEALHPERYPLERLLAVKRTIGSRDWEALYQQKPAPDGGAVFRKEWLRYWLPKDLPQRFDKLLISWDMTFKDSEDSDYVVGQVWGRDGARHFLLDQVRGRMGFTATLQAFCKLADKWPQALEKLVEDKANGPAVIDSLKNRVSGVIPIEPEGGKTARAHAVTPLFEAGNVYIPHPQACAWASDYESELLQFPASAHDDQVDATTQALRRFVVRAPMRINPGILRNVNWGLGALRRWI